MISIKNFDLSRYLGTWYEISRLPNWFEKNLTDVTATYSLKPNGKLCVQNEGTNLVRGKRSVVVGKAKFAGKPNEGYLKVSFFGPFYADYIILEIDPEYQWAMVAGSKKYLWILSRTPSMDTALMEYLRDKAKALGFDVGELRMTPQNSQRKLPE